MCYSLSGYRSVLHTHLESAPDSPCRSDFTQRSVFTGTPHCTWLKHADAHVYIKQKVVQQMFLCSFCVRAYLFTDTNTNERVPSHFTVNHHTSVCSDIHGPLRPAQHAPFLFPVHLLSSACWQDHLVPLLLARFWIIQHNNGLKDRLDRFHSRAASDCVASCPSEIVAVLPIVHTWMHGHSGTMLPLTFKLLINASLSLWPSSGPQGSEWGLCQCTHTNTH